MKHTTEELATDGILLLLLLLPTQILPAQLTERTASTLQNNQCSMSSVNTYIAHYALNYGHGSLADRFQREKLTQYEYTNPQ